MSAPEPACKPPCWLLAFSVVGGPCPWKTPRRGGRGRRGGAFKDERLAAWQRLVATAALGSGFRHRLDSLGAWRLEVDVRVERPPTHLTKSGALRKGKPVYPIRRTGGDLTNLLKGIEDALSGLVWADDAQVVECAGTLRYAGPDFPPGCDVRVRRVEP